VQPVARPYPLPPLPPDQYYVEPLTAEDAGLGALEMVEVSDPFDRYTYRLKSVIASARTAVQNVVIGETFNYGRALFLDGNIQSTQDDEALYHELLVQPAMLRHPAPLDVLVLGGGEGAVLREVVAHASVRSVTMVDIDPELVELAREHLVAWHRGAFEDPRVRLIYGDAREFLAAADALYDVIIVDLVDTIDRGPAHGCYTRQFYELLRNRLRPDGIAAIQGLEFSFVDDKEHVALVRTLRTVFGEVHSYRAHIPSFLGGWGFVVASDWFRPDEWSADAVDRALEQRLGTWVDHLNGAFLKACFAPCKETLLALGRPGPILEDGVPFIPPPDVEEIVPRRDAFPIVAARG
jgi:spermidine synthase